MKPQLSYKRHIAKTITWRIIASITTFLLALAFFKDSENATEKATAIALVESVLKLLFYYLHERLWYKQNLGKIISAKRHLAKTVTWRVVASTTTFVLTLFFFKDDNLATEKATGVMAVEAVLKMGMYYFHERVWYKFDFGTFRKTENE